MNKYTVIDADNYLINPIVTVIIITYNQEKTIRKCIESVVNQEFDYDFEILIGDDCSVDGTKDICIEYQKMYPQKIKLIFQEKNGGVVNNWLSCVKNTKGRYFASCAGDDFWHNSKKIKLQFEYMELNANCGLIYTDFDQLNYHTGEIVKNYLEKNNIDCKQGYGLTKEIFSGNLSIPALTVLFRTETFNTYFPIDDFISRNFPIEDWPAFLVISKYSAIGYINTSTATDLRGHESLSNLKSYEKIINKYEKEKKLYKYICEMFHDDFDYDEKGYDMYVNNILLSLAYKKMDFKYAKIIAIKLKKMGDINVKVSFSKSILLFYMYSFILRYKKYIIK
jgi:glycosyltransferase involved in cell wall biosynthesis